MTAKIWNKNWWIDETREKVLDNTLDRLIRQAGFNVLGTIEHEFTPFGYTKLWLLGESHLALHTFPEENKAYVELSSCNVAYFDAFIVGMDKLFKGVG